jgi:hypothetical protein
LEGIESTVESGCWETWTEEFEYGAIPVIIHLLHTAGAIYIEASNQHDEGLSKSYDIVNKIVWIVNQTQSASKDLTNFIDAIEKHPQTIR